MDFLAASRAQRLLNSAAGVDPKPARRGNRRDGAIATRRPQVVCMVATVFVVGAEDPKFTWIAVELAARMPTADISVIDNAGHAAHIEQPDAVAAVIRRQMDLD